ncbi:MAG: HNH endonuclease [Clostridium lundense]|nr:HNH endonuclease [Clostridium lundense]
MLKCEVCGKKAEIHHIINRCQGGLDCEVNYKYLCSEHHRGKNSPHKNSKIDLEYKLELQEKLNELFCKNFYTLEEIEEILHLNKSKAKKIIKQLKLYKEGYKREDIILKFMGNRMYDEYMMDEYDDFIPLIVV